MDDGGVDELILPDHLDKMHALAPERLKTARDVQVGLYGEREGKGNRIRGII